MAHHKETLPANDISPDRPVKIRTNAEVLESIGRIHGAENASMLDKIAAGINSYYATLKPDEWHRESVPEYESDDKLGRYTFKQLYKYMMNGGFSEAEPEEIALIFDQTDIFEPIISKFLSEISISSPQRTASLLYLSYQINNPFIIPSKETVDIVEQSEAIRVQSGQEPIDDKTRISIEKAIDEFQLASKSWKSAWAYIGSELSSEFVDLLKSDRYGAVLFNDLVLLAQRGNVLYPPQIYSLLRKLSHNGKADISDLHRLYDSGGSLIDLLDRTGALNIKVTGANRAWEYSTEQLHEWIPEKSRDGSMLALGGSVGIVELERAKALGITGDVLIVDRARRLKSIHDALVLKNELAYEPENPEVPHETVYNGQRENSRFIHIPAVLPISSDELRVMLRKHGANPHSPIKIISDQRASALYLQGQNLLDSIRCSIEILSENGGGTYFLTRGLADRLIVDWVLEFNNDQLNGETIKIHLLEHTSKLLNTKEPLTLRRPPLIAEGKTRINSTHDTLPHQQERQASEMSLQQQITAIELIKAKVQQQQLKFIYDYEEGTNNTGFLVDAIASSRGLPIDTSYLPDDKVTEYLNLIQKFRNIIEIAKKSDTGIVLSLLDTDDPYFLRLTANINSFIKKSESDPDVFKNAVETIERLFDQATLPVIVILRKQAESVKESKAQAAENRYNLLKQRFQKQFNEAFSDPVEGLIWNDDIITAILRAYNVEDISKPERKDLTTEDKTTDYDYVITQLVNKIMAVNNSRPYEMDFTGIYNDEYFKKLTGFLLSIQHNDKLFENLIKWADTEFASRSVQSV